MSAAASAAAASTTFFRITLLRSPIGLPRATSGVLAALGLRKRLRTVYHPVSRDVAGMVFAVKELVEVAEVARGKGKAEMREMRKPERGWWVEKKHGEERER